MKPSLDASTAPAGPSGIPAIVARQGRRPIGRVRWIIAAIGTAVAALAHLSGWGGAGAFTLLWLIALACMFGPWLWRALTYRVGVRLLLSYVLIGVMPIALLAVLATLVGYMFIGQYTAVRFVAVEERLVGGLLSIARNAVPAGGSVVPADAVAVLEAARRAPPAGIPHIEYALVAPGVVSTSAGLGNLPVPGILSGSGTADTWTGSLVAGDRAFLGAARRSGEARVLVLLPLDEVTSSTLGQTSWFDVQFGLALTPVRQDTQRHGVAVQISDTSAARGHDAPGQPRITFDGQPATIVGTTGAPSGGPRRWVTWVYPLADPMDWQSGSSTSSKAALVVLKTSPHEAWTDFTGGPHTTAREMRAAVIAVTIGLGVVYLFAVAIAAVQILSITRATARLSRGTLAVAGGNFHHHIPVRRRDQLGDLAFAFNSMVDSVRSMLVEVGEKERLKREMELAREIQQSLLPETTVTHGQLVVHAHFRPASEVGGDYFDVFRLPEGGTIVTVGDVAGHGLPTGLLMAMVKSALGALILEGHRGSELVERLNRLLLQQTIRQRMATLVLAEIVTESGTLAITSCGHPPAFVVGRTGGVAEIALSSLPLGSRLPVEPAVATVPFPPGSALVLYSDGLVEATDDRDRPFGYDGLAGALASAAGMSAREIVAAVLGALEAHLGTRPPADDLTILVVERVAAAVSG